MNEDLDSPYGPLYMILLLVMLLYHQFTKIGPPVQCSQEQLDALDEELRDTTYKLIDAEKEANVGQVTRLRKLERDLIKKIERCELQMEKDEKVIDSWNNRYAVRRGRELDEMFRREAEQTREDRMITRPPKFTGFF